jgi:hypothetical protein
MASRAASRKARKFFISRGAKNRFAPANRRRPATTEKKFLKIFQKPIDNTGLFRYTVIS